MKRLLFAVALLCAYAYPQTINPDQIRPGTVNGQVLTTVTANQPPTWQQISQLVLRHNGTNVTNQSLFNALDNGTIAPDSGYTLAKWLTNSTGGWAAEVPTMPFQMPVSGSPLGIGSLIGTFTNGSGVIEGYPMGVGDGPSSFTVPTGGTQLQLGIDDTMYAHTTPNLGSFTVSISVNGAAATNVTIPATSMPWDPVVNTNFPFGLDDGTAPTVAVTGLSAGDVVTVTYLSGTVQVGPTFPFTDANGWLTTPPGSAGNGGPTGAISTVSGFYPTRYTTVAYLAGVGSGAVQSVFGRTGVVTAQTGDYTVSQVTGAAGMSGTPVVGHCAEWASTTTLGDAGAACGSGGGSGTVTDGTGTTTANLIPTSTGIAHAIQYSNAQVVNCGGVNDTTALQNALNNAGTIIVTGNCVETAHLVIKSNTVLMAYGSTFSYTATSADYLLVNQDAQAIASPQRTFSDGVLTAASTTVTSATASFISADVGSSLRCANGMGTGFYLYTVISAVNSSTSVTVADAPTTSQGTDTCSIFRRDSNITLMGGTYTLGGNLGNGVSYPDLLLETVNGVSLIGVTATEPAGGFWTTVIADVTGFYVSDYSATSPTAVEDGLHIVGPASGGYIAGVTCNTNDDCVPIDTQDTTPGYAGIPGVYGNIAGITVNGVSGHEQGAPAPDEAGVKLYVSNNGATLSLSNVNISNVVGTNNGFKNGVSLLGLGSGSAQTMSNINIGNVGGVIQSQGIDQNGITPSNLTFSSVSGTVPASGSALAGIPNGSQSSPAIQWGTNGIFNVSSGVPGINAVIGGQVVGYFYGSGEYIANSLVFAPSAGSASNVSFADTSGTITASGGANTPFAVSSPNSCCTQMELINTSGGGAHNYYFFTDGSGNDPGYAGVQDATAGANPFAWIGGTQFNFSSAMTLGWTSGASASVSPDTGISRGAANVIDFGNGTHGNATAQVGFASAMPGILYSAAGTPLPTCAVGIKGELATVSDATSPTYMGAYSSGGAITASVICSFDGTTYSWKTH